MLTSFLIVRDDLRAVRVRFSREASGCQTGTISERRRAKERQRIADAPQTEAGETGLPYQLQLKQSLILPV